MDTPDKLLSVIVPSYNMEEYLPKCLESLIVPDEAMLERLDVIVVNDGSKDRTSEIAHDFERRYPGIFRVIDKPNGNYGSCINVALPVAAGVYVKILDADDTFCQMEFHRYLKFLACLSDEEYPDVIVNDFVVVDNDGNETACHRFGTDDDTSFSLSCIDYRQERYMWMHALAYRTEMIQSTNYHQTEGISYTDQEWVAIPMMTAHTFHRFPGVVYRYLVGRQGQTVEQSVKLRNYSMHLTVMQSVVTALRDRRGTLSQENEHFVRDLVEAHLRWFYREYLVSHHNILNQSDIRDFDIFLENTDAELYFSVADEAFYFTKWRIPFRHVRSWRRKRSRRTMGFLLCDTAMGLRHLWHRIQGC